MNSELDFTPNKQPKDPKMSHYHAGCYFFLSMNKKTALHSSCFLSFSEKLGYIFVHKPAQTNTEKHRTAQTKANKHEQTNKYRLSQTSSNLHLQLYYHLSAFL